jgi:hypothetical protein
MRNRLIDAGFTINQRSYVSNTALASGVYAHDRWKAGSGGCTYTFTQGSTGVPIVITITAGSLQQVIEGANMPEGGTYVLSWTGTAQARFNGGTYSSSPLAVTGITAGANITIEFNTGTCSFPQLESGTQATSFEYRQYQQELALCQRYYVNGLNYVNGFTYNATTGIFGIIPPVTFRATPTVGYTSGSTVSVDFIGGTQNATISIAAGGAYASTKGISLAADGLSGRTTWQGIILVGGNWFLSAEL